MNQMVTVVAYPAFGHRRSGRIKVDDGCVARGIKEVKIPSIEKSCCPGRAFTAEDTTTLPAMLCQRYDEFGARDDWVLRLTCLRSQMENFLRQRNLSHFGACESGCEKGLMSDMDDNQGRAYPRCGK